MLPTAALEALEPAFEVEYVGFEESLFEAGDEVAHAHFPLDSTVAALVLPMRDGLAVHAAAIGSACDSRFSETIEGDLFAVGIPGPWFGLTPPARSRSVVRLAWAGLTIIPRASPVAHDPE